MAEYRTIKMSFWNDPYVEELSASGKLLYMYLFTCPYTNNLGILEVSAKRIAYETGIDTAEVQELFSTMERDGKIVTDGTLTWIVKFVKHQASTSPKLLQSLKGILCKINSEKIRKAVCMEYPHIFEHGDTPSAPSDTHSEPYSNGTDTVSIPSEYPTDTVSEPYEHGIDTRPGIGRGIGKGSRNIKPHNTSNNITSAPAHTHTREEDFFGEGETPEPTLAPSLEFTELRQFYSENVRSEGELTGFTEYKQAKASHDWPGVARIIDDLNKRLEAGEFKKNYGISLRRYITERYWNSPVTPRARPRRASEPTLFERNAAVARQVLAELEAEGASC